MESVMRLIRFSRPFADAVKAGVASFMCSYNLLNNSQACQNSYLLNHILKDELGFQGYVMSDWQATASGVPAVLAGLDMTMAGDIRFGDGDSYFGANLTIAVLNGTVPQWRLDDMVVRILAGWYLVDGDDEIDLPNFQSWTPYTNGAVHAHVGPTWGTGVVNKHVDVRQQHGELIRHIGAASTVLLKNTKGALPLTNKEKLTAVIGEDAGSNPLGPNGCRNHGCDVGTLGVGWGSGQADFPYLISPDAAIQHEVTSRYGSYQSITNNTAFTQIDTLAKRVTEVAGVCLVFANADSGEGFINIENNFGDRKNLTLWQGADSMIANVSSSCNNTVLILHTVGAVEIDQYKDNENITAILWAGLPGKIRSPSNLHVYPLTSPRRTIRKRHRRHPLRPRQPRCQTPLHHRRRALRLRHRRPLHPQPRRPPIQLPRRRLPRLPHLRPPQHHPRLRIRLRPQLHHLRLLRPCCQKTKRLALQACLRILGPGANLRHNRQPHLRAHFPRRPHSHPAVYLPLAQQH
jgi:hypothetical protein